MNKDNLFRSMFLCNWNIATNEKEAFVIALFCKKEGFCGLLNFIRGEQIRLKEEFKRFYSEELLDILKQLSDNNEDNAFIQYILASSFIKFNKHNFLMLDEKNLLTHFSEFKGDFRGNIQEILQVDGGVFFHTDKGFYYDKYLGLKFDGLPEALLYHIYDGNYYDTLMTLLQAMKTNG